MEQQEPSKKAIITRWTDTESKPINGADSYAPPLPDWITRLQALAALAKADVFRLRHPETEWMPKTSAPDGGEMIDVLVVGAGQGGLAIAGLLIKERVSNILVIDKEPAGSEGIWNSHGRMPIIRSPKHYPGPDMGIPHLTYESWHRACFGDSSWEALIFVPIVHWISYLGWVKETLDISIENQTELLNIAPSNNCLKISLKKNSERRTIHARRVVLATGHDGTGHWWLPKYLSALPANHCARAADKIDFNSLKGKKVAILGVGATAGDNAICALEAGADVHMFCRRDTHRRQQVYRWCITAGFLRHFGDLDDATRWRFMHYILNTRMGMPPETWQRANAYANFTLHTNSDWKDAKSVEKRVEIQTSQGIFEADFIISCVGHDQDVTKRPELKSFSDQIRLWRDQYTPPKHLLDARLARYPYLGKSFEFLEKDPGSAPFLSRIHDFTFGPTMSFGPSGCSISTLRLTVPMVVAGITKSLFLEDANIHWKSLLDHPNMIP
ncbi:MAG: oxidoreductase [Rhodospirillaceae bacterium]|nr:oxidoreductase [Rhodospirillaceae bacterium]